jgi:hypothetical protein
MFDIGLELLVRPDAMGLTPSTTAFFSSITG